MTHISERLLVQAHLAAKQPRVLSEQESAEHRAAIAAELKAQNAVLVAHYYCDPVIQALAEETGGCVSDSLEMARFGNQHPAQTVVVAGVRFMGETAKILNPEKRVLEKVFIEAPPAGNGAACRSCAHCPWMAMNTLERTLACLREGSGEIFVDPALIPRAVRPLKRMLDFTQAARLRQAGNA